MTLTWIRAAEDVMIVALENGSQVFPPITIVLRADSNTADSQEAYFMVETKNGKR
jgi:hypothetical protein